MNRPRFTSRLNARLAVVATAAALALAACGSSSSGGTDSPSATAKGSITIGHQAFGESEIAAHLYGDALAKNGYTVNYQSFKDRAAIYAALESGDINLVPDYAASALEFLNGNAGEASPDITATKTKLDAALAAKKLASAAASAAVDSNSLVVTKATAESKKLTAISNLTPGLKLGGPQDCPSNAGCLPALKKTYGLDLSSSFVPLDLGGPLTKAALEKGDIDVAVIFSTDASIADKGWVVLKDDKGIFNADNILPVGTQALISAEGAQLDKVSAALTTANVTEMNKRYDVDKEDAAVIAKDFEAANKL